MGPVPPADSEATPVGSNNGSSMNVDAGNQTNSWQRQLAPQDAPASLSAPAVGKFVASVVLEAARESSIRAAPAAEMQIERVATEETERNVVNPVADPVQVKSVPNLIQLAAALASRLKSVIVGPSAAKDTLVPVIPSLIKQVSNFIPCCPISSSFKYFSILYISHDTPVPPYFSDSDSLVHLAFILHPQLGGNALEKLALEYLDEEEEEDLETVVAHDLDDDEEVMMEPEEDMIMEEKEDSDLEMLDGPPQVFMTPKKKRAFKVKQKLDDEFLRRSKRVSKKLGGFKSANKHKEAETGKKTDALTKESKKSKATKKSKKANAEASTQDEVLEPTPIAMIPLKELWWLHISPRKYSKALDR